MSGQDDARDWLNKWRAVSTRADSLTTWSEHQASISGGSWNVIPVVATGKSAGRLRMTFGRRITPREDD